MLRWIRAPLLILLMATTAFAGGEKVYLDQAFLSRGIPVIDIRTPGEWRQTGIVEGSHTLMFFDERGQYDLDRFLIDLSVLINIEEPFAIICRTGRRTALLQKLLTEQGYQVIDILGGVTHVTGSGTSLVPYAPE